MYVKDLTTGKIMEIRTEMGKLIKSDLTDEIAKEQVQTEIEIMKKKLKENMKEAQRQINILKKVIKSINKEIGKYKEVEAYERESDALDRRNELEKQGEIAKVRSAGRNSKNFKENKIWVVEKLEKRKTHGNEKNDK